MVVKMPSTKKSHLQHLSQDYFWKHANLVSDLQAVKPSLPSRPAKIPDAMRALKALLTELPQVRSAVRNPSSLRLYLERFQYTKLEGHVMTIPSRKKEYCPGKERCLDKSKQEAQDQSRMIPEAKLTREWTILQQ
jgi:hypothetical protein